ncbi:MAG: phage tail protein [Pleurocapsa minor GSE-CHR-MK-17-07R]|jgi:phage tail-like protein|nr:phage tail protein [Pleurocapsa minor GSE-CHR-MK 17-07R]
MLSALPIPLPPIPGLTMETHSLHRFTVAIDVVPFSAFTECRLPTIQIETDDIKEGGLNTRIHRLPARVNAGTVVLKHGVAHIDFMMAWYMLAMNHKIKLAQRTMIITMYDSLFIPLNRWTFINAFPIKWTGPTLASGTSAVAVEELEVVHEGFVVTPI